MMLSNYKNGALCVADVVLADIAAACGTPTYVYDQALLEARWLAYDRAFGARRRRVCYAVKANDNLSILRVLGDQGAAFDIVSGGELARVIAAGASASEAVFSGVGKRRDELEYALTNRIGCINLESVDELDRVVAAAAVTGCDAAVAVRVNPDVDARTHPYISTGLKTSKFGVPIADAMALYERIRGLPRVNATGIACHIGSQLTTLAPMLEAVDQVVAMAGELAASGSALEHIDVGGGLGIRYQDETPPAPGALVAALLERVPEHYTIVMEPGRSIVGPTGLLLTRVEYIKRAAAKNFIIVDAAMNDLLRPSLYEAWHEVRPCHEHSDAPLVRGDVVGPICESGDWLARDRELAVTAGDLIAILDTGAYGIVMASNYNSRPRPAEVLVHGDAFRVIRDRESMETLLANELAYLPVANAPK